MGRNMESRRIYLKKRYRVYKEKYALQQRANWLKKLYGITVEEYNHLFDLQQGKCAICGRHQKDLKRRLCVDHCHTTGRVRGLLCNTCNPALAIVDNPIWLGKAKAYLGIK